MKTFLVPFKPFPDFSIMTTQYLFNILYLVNCFSSRTLLDTDKVMLKEKKNQLIKNALCK